MLNRIVATQNILMEHLSAYPGFSGVCVAQSFVLCVVVCRSLFVFFPVTIALYVFLRFTDSDYSCGIYLQTFLLVYRQSKSIMHALLYFWCINTY